jgi:superkiller protein 3
MNSYRRPLTYLALLVLLGGAAYFGYWWYNRTFLPEPTPPAEDEVVSDTAPVDVDVTLPEDLEEDLQQDRERQRTLFEEAAQAHSNGNLERAVDRYRRAIGHSGPDDIAANAYRYLGDIYSRIDRLPRALRLYDFALKIRPEDALIHYRKGMTHWENGGLDQAGSSLDRALELDPRGDFFLARGNLHFEQGEFDEAENAYEQGLDEGGEDVELRLWINLGRARTELGEQSDALRAYEQALGFDPSPELRYKIHMNRGALLHEQENYSAAAREFSLASELDATVEALYNLGLARGENGNLDGAVEALRQARNRSPEDVEILTDLGQTYQQQGDYQNAIQYYEDALEQDPENPDLIFALARLHERANEPREALGYYERLVERGRNEQRLAMTYRRVGELYLNTDRPERAAPAFRNVLSLEAGNPEVHYNLAIAYRRTGELERAIEEYRRALELEPDSVRYQFALADTLYRADFVDRALEAYEQVLELDSTRDRARYMIAYLHYRRGDLRESRKRFQALLENLQEERLQAKTYQNLGNIYLRNREYSNASTSYRQALNIQEAAETYFNFGLVKVYQENWDVAATVFRRALERDPDDPEFKMALGLVLYERGLYREARSYLEEALDEAPDSLRGQYDLRTIRQTLDQLEARSS